MASQSGGPGPWGNASGSSGDGDGRKPSGGPWGQGGGEPAGDGDGTEPRRGSRKPGEQGRFGGGPFRNGPFGGGSNPDLDRLIAKAQAWMRRLMGDGNGPGGGGRFGPGRLWRGGTSLLFLALLAVLLWAASGFYRVQPDEEGVVLRFGAYSYWTPPGLHWHLPWPIETVRLPAVTRINRIEIGYRSSASGGAMGAGRDGRKRDVLAESLMLTGDENIIDIDFAVFWRIAPNQAPEFLFNTADPEGFVRAVAESSLREVIGRTPIQPALTQARAQIEAAVLKQTQDILNRYQAGVEIMQVQLQKVDPPAAVIESFRDVQRAYTDAERMRNEAQTYRNDIVPRARGNAARIVAEAEGQKAAAVAQATGQAQRFDSVLKAYQAAKDVTLRRLYLDTMQDVLSHARTLVVDDKLKGIVPYLPLIPPPAAAPPVATPAVPAAPAAPATSAGPQATATVGAQP
jgi:membrane protease subunit HflK